jgi:hypothetical protein
MSEYKDFTSLPPEKEQEFVVYEKTSVEAGKKAKIIALIVAASFLALTMGIVFSFEPPKSKMADDDMGALAAPKKPKKEAKPATPTGEAPKAEGAATGEGAAAGEGAAGTTGDKPAAEGAPAGAAAGAAAGATEDKPAAEGAKPEGK